MKNPFTNEPMISVENGSLADFYKNGGTEEMIFDKLLQHNGNWWTEMKIGDTKRLKFECPAAEENYIYEIQVWILKIDEGKNEENFRFCHSSQGVQEQRVLRGWND